MDYKGFYTIYEVQCLLCTTTCTFHRGQTLPEVINEVQNVQLWEVTDQGTFCDVCIAIRETKKRDNICTIEEIYDYAKSANLLLVSPLTRKDVQAVKEKLCLVDKNYQGFITVLYLFSEDGQPAIGFAEIDDGSFEYGYQLVLIDPSIKQDWEKHINQTVRKSK